MLRLILDDEITAHSNNMTVSHSLYMYMCQRHAYVMMTWCLSVVTNHVPACSGKSFLSWGHVQSLHVPHDHPYSLIPLFPKRKGLLSVPQKIGSLKMKASLYPMQTVFVGGGVWGGYTVFPSIHPFVRLRCFYFQYLEKAMVEFHKVWQTHWRMNIYNKKVRARGQFF